MPVEPAKSIPLVTEARARQHYSTFSTYCLTPFRVGSSTHPVYLAHDVKTASCRVAKKKKILVISRRPPTVPHQLVNRFRKLWSRLLVGGEGVRRGGVGEGGRERAVLAGLKKKFIITGGSLAVPRYSVFEVNRR